MVGLSKKRVFPKTKGDSITGQDRAQKHCDFRFSQIEKKILSRSSATIPSGTTGLSAVCDCGIS